jgi:monoamine oxidase
VLVIGAGAAGLAAARDLSHAGLHVGVIEARDRIGGRIHTVHDPRSPLPIELGAEFVHGEARETLSITQAARLMVIELPEHHFRSRGGRFTPIADFWGVVERMNQELARRTRRGGDFAVADYLSGARPASRRAMLRDFIEGYHAAHPERMSARALAAAAGGNGDARDTKQFRVASGGDALVQWLRDGLDPERTEVRQSTVVEAIAWRPGRVTLHCRGGDGAALEPLRGRAVIVTAPLAVLRAGSVRIEPALPAAKQRALRLLETGHIFKIVLRFRRAFWDEDQFVERRMTGRRNGAGAALNFVHAHAAELPTWWTALPARAPTLTGWVGGPRAEALLAEPPAIRLERAMAALRVALGVPRRMLDELLDAWSSHDWRADPFSLGAYSYVGVGGTAAPRALARPVQDTLFFAGEATEGDQMGTVAGALASGRRAAREVLRVLER